jgi:hypothetical protein
MARTGLRMMPTFPSPPLKFRTAGFPRYGFKASMSDGTFLSGVSVKPAPGIPSQPSVCLRPSHTSVAGKRLALCPGQPVRPCAAAREACASLPQGSLAPTRVMLSRSIVAYYDPIRQSHRHAATSRPGRLYAAPSLCGSASATRGTFPTFADVPSIACRRPYPDGPAVPSRCTHTAIPGFLYLSPSRHPRRPSLPAMSDGVFDFGAASFALCYDLHVCLALLTGYDGMKSRALHRAF